MEKWYVATKRADFKELSKRFGIDQVTARIIRNRDITDEGEIDKYLNGTINDLYPPEELKDVKKAVSILKEKIESQKKIRIIGDYDIDGVQSVYILYSGLKKCGAMVDYAIPDRIADGYGVNNRLIEQAKEAEIDTILTCDNGIAATEALELVKQLNMTVIVTDHHEVPYQKENGEKKYLLPPADAIVNPKQEDCPYPNKGLCGAAVAFKLIQVLYPAMGIEAAKAMEFLENAAFATVGDVMDLTGENRILVKEGLKKLNHTTNFGMRALAAKNNIPMGTLKSYHIGFVLGPCLNASGRLDTAKRALELLLARNEAEAASCATDLYDLNASRKELTEAGVEQAKALVEETELKKDKVLVIYLPECHESLAGIIAGRIRERYHRPVFVLTRGEEGVKGSGRSIESYSMYDEMVKCSHLFTKFGGHPMAAGLSMPEENVDIFRRQMNENTTLTEEDLLPKIMIDVPMPLDYISKGLIEELKCLEPFGKSNEKPVFADKNIRLLSMRIIGKNQNVCKMQVESQAGTRMEAVYFGNIQEMLAFYKEKYGEQALEQTLRGNGGMMLASFVYYPEVNEYNGRESLQIIVKNYC
ncbi:MAG: single-stranded-DNA-specific exonuclease RecJ [Clostridiales bacterium]|nr:single-stranded-DNA-specific exonuclease RecJ [Clostridiales bacterium]